MIPKIISAVFAAALSIFAHTAVAQVFLPDLNYEEDALEPYISAEVRKGTAMREDDGCTLAFVQYSVSCASYISDSPGRCLLVVSPSESILRAGVFFIRC